MVRDDQADAGEKIFFGPLPGIELGSRALSPNRQTINTSLSLMQIQRELSLNIFKRFPEFGSKLTAISIPLVRCKFGRTDFLK